jgi:hypothetical protein
MRSPQPKTTAPFHIVIRTVAVTEIPLRFSNSYIPSSHRTFVV